MSLLANSAVIGGEIDAGDIGHSLRFRSAASTDLSRTFSAPTSNTSWALSLFDKRGTLSTIQSIFSAGDSDIRYNVTTDTISISKDGSVVATSTAVFRDITAPVHLFFRSNGTNVKGYRNTEEILSYTGTIPDFNSAILHTIGKYAGAATEYFDGYRSRICFVDGGGSLTPQDFVTFNSEINEWVTKTEAEVKAVVNAGGNNSTMLEFKDATSLTTLGYDNSSKGNNWTLNGFSLTAGSTYDWMLDVPGNSYATLNPLVKNANGTLADGNIKFTATAASATRSSSIPPAYKVYGEIVLTTKTAPSWGVVVSPQSVADSNLGVGPSGFYGLYLTGTTLYRIVNGSASPSTTRTINNGDVVQYAYDPVNGNLWLGHSNTWFDSSLGTTGNPSGNSNPTITGIPSGCFIVTGESGTIEQYSCFGQAPLHASATYRSEAGGYFRYTPPAGFKALCQANLPENGTVIVSGAFTGNVSADGPCVWMNGTPKTLTINGNAVTFGTHADRLATGFKIRTASTSYNSTGTNTWTATIDSNLKNIFKYNNGQGN